MKRFIALFSVFLLIPSLAHATRTVTSPYVDEGVLKLKWKGGATHDDDSASRDGAWSSKVGAEYGFTNFFSVEVEGDAENPGNSDDTDYAATSVKAKMQFTDKGEGWLDAGARLSYEANHGGGADSVEFKFIVARDDENFRHVANFILDREVGDDSSDDSNFGFSWSSRYKWLSAFEPGFEIYSNTGAMSDGPDFEEQDHSIGPVAYGKITDNIKYEAGYLAGFSDNASDGRFKAVLEYGIKF